MLLTEPLLAYEETLAKAREEAVVGRDGVVWGSGGLGLAARGMSECEFSCSVSRDTGYHEAEKCPWG